MNREQKDKRSALLRRSFAKAQSQQEFIEVMKLAA